MRHAAGRVNFAAASLNSRAATQQQHCASSTPLLRAGGPDYSVVTRNLALELVRVTEAAALSGAAWLGKGDKNAADQVQHRPAGLKALNLIGRQ